MLVKLILKRYIGVKGIEANLNKRNPSYSIVNTIGGKYLRALRRPNKGKKYNSNTLKNRNNKTKRLALLGTSGKNLPAFRQHFAALYCHFSI